MGKMARVARAVAFALGWGSAALTAVQGRAFGDAELVLVVSGGAGVRVEGACTLRTATGETVEPIAEAVPFERRWHGTGLRCELAADGPVTVEVSRAGNRSRTSTSGGRLVVEVR